MDKWPCNFTGIKKLAELNHFKFLQMIFKNINPTRPDKMKIQVFFLNLFCKENFKNVSSPILHYIILYNKRKQVVKIS